MIHLFLSFIGLQLFLQSHNEFENSSIRLPVTTKLVIAF